MRRTSTVASLFAVCLIAATAGCGSKSADAGSGGLTGVSPTQTSTTPTAATTQTTKPTSTSTKTTTPTSDWPSPGDCVNYNPTNLTVDGTGASGTFVISSGSTVVVRVHGQEDQTGQQALALAQRYKTHCYIGRKNTRDPKGDYIMDYWRNPSGQTPPIPGIDDLCSPYNNKNLTIENMGDNNGWRVKDHDHVLHVFDNGADAHDGAKVFLKYSSVCSIGESLDTDADLGQVTFQQ